MTSLFLRIMIIFFWASVAALAIFTSLNYKGNLLFYIAFTISCHLLIINGFRRRAFFFDTFIGIFFWLGFWLKTSIHVSFFNGVFAEPVGAFDGSGAAFDTALLVSTLGFLGLLAASSAMRLWFRYPEDTAPLARSGLYAFYLKSRIPILLLFIGVVAFFTITNAWLVIYQRGMVSQTILPFGISGIYRWVLQFGFATVSALIIRFEIERNSTITNAAVIVPIIELFLSNVSLLSRGMILNGAGLGIGVWRTLHWGRRTIPWVRVVFGGALFTVLFVSSVYTVNALRAHSINDSVGAAPAAGELARQTQGMVTSLFLARWVGIEGVMAVSSSQHRGWELWNEAWRERFQEGVPSLYDRLLIDSPYLRPGGDIDTKRFHFVSLPGLVAFLFFPGSYLFLFVMIFLFGVAALFLEIASYKLSKGNLILTALIGQTIAFRFVSFGYVPAQSYLLFGTLVVNVVLIAVLDRLLVAVGPKRE